MRHSILISTLGLGLLLGGAAWGDESSQDSQRVQSGAATYQRYCASCHGASGSGDGPVAATLDPRPEDLTRIAARNGGVFPEATVMRMIDGRDPVVAHGTREMPVWGQRFHDGLPPGSAAHANVRGQLLVIVDYLKTIQQP